MDSISLFFHIIGVGLLFCGVVGIPIIESMFRSALDARSAHTIHKIIVRLGIVTPVASAVLLLSGISNIVLHNIVVYREGWLILKLALFAVMAAAGILQGRAYRKRGRLVEAIALGDAPASSSTDTEMLTRKLATFSRIQISLLALILLVTVFRAYL